MRWPLHAERYDEIRTAVADFIDDWGINVYPFSMWSLLRKMGISLVSYSILPNNVNKLLEKDYPDAFTVYPHDFNPLKTTIYYNDKLGDRNRIRFSLAHELGHLILMHSQPDETTYEHEADVFANYFLAPAPLIIRYSKINYSVVAVDFAVSHSCAASACDRAAKRYNYGPSIYTEYEQRILNMCTLEKGGGRLVPV